MGAPTGHGEPIDSSTEYCNSYSSDRASTSMGHTDLSVREGRGDYTGGEYGDIGHRTRITAQPCGLRAHIHRVLLDRSPVPHRRRARDRAGEVNKERVL